MATSQPESSCTDVQTSLLGPHVCRSGCAGVSGTDAQTVDTTSTRSPTYVAHLTAHARLGELLAYKQATMGHRLPTILGKGIDDVWKTLNQEHDEDRIVDLVNCIHRLEDLMNDLQGNSKLRPIIDDGAGDIALWNKVCRAKGRNRDPSDPQEIAKFFRGKDFMNAPWLFAEAYKYRRLRECFSLSKYWVDYDVFFRQKCDTFSRSSQAVFELSMRFSAPQPAEANLSEDARREKNKLIFHELSQGESAREAGATS